jgi:hypothetical protein
MTLTLDLDFGIVLGCRIFIKEITNRSLIDKETSLQEGDIVVKVILKLIL